MERTRLAITLALIGAGAAFNATAQSVPSQFHLIETTVPKIQQAMQTRLLSSEELVGMYLKRIKAYDDAGPKLNSYIYINPLAAAEAKALDDKRFLPGTKVGPLYGVPVALKDIVDTYDMPTTGGAYALANSIPTRDAFITKKLREAGAVIIGKLTLTEFANFIGAGLPGGYSGLGGYGFNPYDPRVELLPDGTVRDGRPILSPAGSSSGSGIAAAANLTALTIGTETSGSILSPANANGIVGIKPTVGLVSRDGIIPITADQDTAGPMTRSVTDAAIMLGVIAGYDAADKATEACLQMGRCLSDYTPYLNPGALRGARLAVPEFPNNVDASRRALVEAAIVKMQAAGATVARIPALPNAFGPGVLNYGQKRDVNLYLDRLPETFPIQSLTDLIAFNANPPAPLTTADTIKYTQSAFIASNALDISPGSAATAIYITNRDNGYALSRSAIDNAMNGPDGLAGTGDDYDAVVYSGAGSAGTWARAGYPSIVLPLGFVPATYDAQVSIPTGISFAGRPWSEARLISLGYAFEQLNNGRLPPASAPALASDTVLRGDVNRDGAVNSTDIALTARRMNQTATGPYDKSDLNGDGRITGADVSALTKLCTGTGCGR